MTPAAKRQAVAHVCAEHDVSQRRACQTLDIDRSTIRYRSRRPGDEEVRQRIADLAKVRRRFGYRRLHFLLGKEGVSMNLKRFRRLYREEGLQVRKRGGRKQAPLGVPVRPNERWSLDFVSDSFTDGRESGSTEHRLILEATGRFELPADVWLVNRVRVDLRDVDGVISERFRYRLGIEKEFTVQGLTLVPNAQVEFFYDTRFNDWSRQRYQAGVEIGLTGNIRLEPYLAYEKDVRPTTTDLVRAGLVFKYYW